MSLNLGYLGDEGCDGGKWLHSQMAEWVSFKHGLKMKERLKAHSVHFTNRILSFALGDISKSFVKRTA